MELYFVIYHQSPDLFNDGCKAVLSSGVTALSTSKQTKKNIREGNFCFPKPKLKEFNFSKQFGQQFDYPCLAEINADSAL